MRGGGEIDQLETRSYRKMFSGQEKFKFCTEKARFLTTDAVGFRLLLLFVSLLLFHFPEQSDKPEMRKLRRRHHRERTEDLL